MNLYNIKFKYNPDVFGHYDRGQLIWAKNEELAKSFLIKAWKETYGYDMEIESIREVDAAFFN